MGYHYYYNDYYGSVDNLDGVAFYRRTARNGEHSYYVDIMWAREEVNCRMIMITKSHSDN